MRALSIAASGMAAQQTNVDVIANNIANVNTTGYKRARAEFTDLLYQAERSAGTPGRSDEGAVPEGTNVGLGVRFASVRNLHIQGVLNKTGNQLDLSLNGRGWFMIDGANGETLYTRSGAFNKNADGQLVTIDGQRVQPGIDVPDNATEVVVTESGQVLARVGTSTELTSLGQLVLATFPNEAGLTPIGNNLFRENEGSGAPTAGVPGDPGFGLIKQGYLESSNVDPVKEITELIGAQRAYEMNSKVIQAADEMYATVTKGLR